MASITQEPSGSSRPKYMNSWKHGLDHKDIRKIKLNLTEEEFKRCDAEWKRSKREAQRLVATRRADPCRALKVAAKLAVSELINCLFCGTGLMTAESIVVIRALVRSVE